MKKRFGVPAMGMASLQNLSGSNFQWVRDFSNEAHTLQPLKFKQLTPEIHDAWKMIFLSFGGPGNSYEKFLVSSGFSGFSPGGEVLSFVIFSKATIPIESWILCQQQHPSRPCRGATKLQELIIFCLRI